MNDRRDDAELIAASLTDPAQLELVFDRHYDAIHRHLARRRCPPADFMAGA